MFIIRFINKFDVIQAIQGIQGILRSFEGCVELRFGGDHNYKQNLSYIHGPTQITRNNM